MSSNPAAAPEENEPSMEEILASIRKIIADDSLGTKKDEPQPKKPVAAAPPPPPPAPEMPPVPVAVDVMVDAEDEDADVLDLAQVASVAPLGKEVTLPPPAPAEDTFMMPQPVEVMVTPPPMPAMPMPQAVDVMAPPPVHNVATLEDRIISDNTSSLVGQAFAQLSLQRNTPMPAVGRSLEDVVVELLRPMLRTWIDEHLPSVVEKLVKAEIERVARGG